MCIFCKIVNKEIPSKTLYEDDYFIAFLDVNPIVLGHTVIVSKRHCMTIYELNEAEQSDLGVAISKVSSILKDEFGSNVSLVNTSGEEASQSVPHFHMHVIPRSYDDRLWEGEKSLVVLDRSSGFERLQPSSEELDELKDKLLS